MRALWLDFQQEEPGRRRSGLILLALGVLVSSLLLARYVSVADNLSAAERQLSRLQRAETPARLSAGAVAELPPAAHWESLFQALEAAGDDTVTLLRLQSGKDGILISGEASSLDASLAYASRLQLAPLLADVHMTQSEVVTDHPQRPLRFSLVAAGRGGRP